MFDEVLLGDRGWEGWRWKSWGRVVVWKRRGGVRGNCWLKEVFGVEGVVDRWIK